MSEPYCGHDECGGQAVRVRRLEAQLHAATDELALARAALGAADRFIDQLSKLLGQGAGLDDDRELAAKVYRDARLSVDVFDRKIRAGSDGA